MTITYAIVFFVLVGLPLMLQSKYAKAQYVGGCMFLAGLVGIAVISNTGMHTFR